MQESINRNALFHAPFVPDGTNAKGRHKHECETGEYHFHGAATENAPHIQTQSELDAT